MTATKDKIGDPPPGPIDYPALAGRYLELWQEQVAKLGQDPAAIAAMFQSWGKMIGAAGAMNPFAGKFSEAVPVPPSGSATSRPTPSPPSSGGGDLDHAALLRRIDALERRIAELEAERGSATESAPQPARASAARPAKPRAARKPT